MTILYVTVRLCDCMTVLYVTVRLYGCKALWLCTADGLI